MPLKEWGSVRPATKVWAMVSRQTASPDEGVDFELRFHEAYPMLMTDTRPLRMTSTLSEGTP